MSQPEQERQITRTALGWPAEWHAAYLESRPDATSAYDPAAEYGDADWREPASEAEAAARTAWLAENTPPTTGWPSRPLTEVENALEDAQERAVLADRAHDPDPYAWAQYQRLQALNGLAPLPTHDPLDDLPRDEHGASDALAAGAPTHDEDQVVRDHRADEAAFDGRDLEGRDEHDRLRRRIETLRASVAARTQEGLPDDEQRREQLARWHDDDHATRTAADSWDSGDVGVRAPDWAGESGWGR